LIYVNPRMDTLFVTVPEYTKDWLEVIPLLS